MFCPCRVMFRHLVKKMVWVKRCPVSVLFCMIYSHASCSALTCFNLCCFPCLFMNALFVSPVPYCSSLPSVFKYVCFPVSWALSTRTLVFLKIFQCLHLDVLACWSIWVCMVTEWMSLFNIIFRRTQMDTDIATMEKRHTHVLAMFYRQIIPEHSAQEQLASFKVSSVSKQLTRENNLLPVYNNTNLPKTFIWMEIFFFSKIQFCSTKIPVQCWRGFRRFICFYVSFLVLRLSHCILSFSWTALVAWPCVTCLCIVCVMVLSVFSFILFFNLPVCFCVCIWVSNFAQT